jgi:hypothetical protein
MIKVQKSLLEFSPYKKFAVNSLELSVNERRGKEPDMRYQSYHIYIYIYQASSSINPVWHSGLDQLARTSPVLYKHNPVC